MYSNVLIFVIGKFTKSTYKKGLWRRGPKKFRVVAASILLALGSLGVISCDFFADGELEERQDTQLSYFRLSSTSTSVKVGEMAYVYYTYSPSTVEIDPKFDYDEDYIDISSVTNSGFVVTGKKEGQCAVSISAGGKSCTCIVSVSGYSENYIDTTEPYIYSNSNIVQLSPGNSQRIYVSLYNGTVTDNLSYSWTIENPSIASLSSNGQYCLINALAEGYSRIKVTNTAAAYPYYVGVYVLSDPTATTYITSTDNIKTVYVNKGEESISVDLVNPKSELYKSYFNWEINDGDKDCIEIVSNQNECTIKPIKGGQCTIRVTNKEADNNIPLDILVRSVEIVDSAYIEPSLTIVNLNGEEEKTLNVSIATLTADKDYSPSDFTYEVDDDYYVEWWSFRDQVTFKGLHNGSTSLYISHPSCQKKRQVLIVCENQIADAVDSSCYITTSQNYIKTKVGSEETTVSVILKGGTTGDERKFNWDIKQNPDDGTSDVISVTTTNDNTYTSSRAATSSVEGTLIIKPLSEGTATITVTNPKSYYPTEILVKVLNSAALLDSPLYFKGDGLVKFLNSETYTYTISLNGDAKTTSDESSIKWSTSSSTLKIAANETTAELSSVATGSTVHNMTVDHSKVEAPKEVLVLTADTQEELDSIKAFYSNKTYYSVNVGKTVNIYASAVGYTDDEGNELDFSTVTGVSWTSSDPSVFTIEASEDSPLCGVIKGVKSGTATAKITYEGTTAEFHVTVYPENIEIGTVETTCYLSTAQNVVVIPQAGSSTTISISAIGMKSSEYKNIEWTSSDESIATVIGNGTTATVTSVKEGECVLYAKHTLSENELKIYVRIGEKYITTSKAVKYITANTDIITITKDSDSQMVQAYLVNGSESDKTGFSFALEDENIASLLSGYTTGEAYIKPVTAGQTELIISHNSTDIKKHIPIIIGNTEEELKGFKYLTTSNNVVTLVEGNSKKISVSVENTDEVVLSGYTWSSSNNSVAGIQTSATSTAIIVGNSPGTTIITCKNESAGCKYGVDIIVQVLDAETVASCPYISCPKSVMELTVSTSFTTVTAELLGGTETDALDFTWTSDDSSVLEAYGQNGVGKVRAVSAGITYLRISHPKAPYDQLVMCICSEEVTSDCSIEVSSGNILSVLPTDTDKTITASLVNGSATDKYNFSWSLDVYDVVDMTYSANTAIITPLKEGIAQLIIHHPKSAYDQTVVIKVQQYSSFAFGTDTKTIVAGETSYVSMQVPTANVTTTVEYSVDNPQVATVTGTNAVCAITGLQKGTCVVHAKMKAGTTTYAETKTDLLVNITPAAEETSYISGTQTIYTMDIGDSKTFTATLFGTSNPTTDIYTLEWITGNPSILRLAGSVQDSEGNYKATGASVYGTAINSGETTLTVRHPDVKTDLVYHIIVSEEGDHSLSLSKTYVTLDKGKKTELTATIDNGTSDEYKTISWTCDKPGETEIVRLLADSGKTTAIYAVRAGTTYVYATTSSGKCEKCQVTVTESKKLSFGYSTVKVQPIAEYARTIDYVMFPTEATLNWSIMSTDGKEHFTITNNGIYDQENGKGSITISGLSASATSTKVTFYNSYGNSTTLNVLCNWDNEFSLLATPKINGEPTGEYTIKYQVSPSGSTFNISQPDCATITEVIESKDIEKRTGYFKIVPKCDTTSSGEDVEITAINPATQEIVGTETLNLKFGYKNIPLSLKLVSREDGAQWTTVDNETATIYLGDGEKANFRVLLGGENCELNKVQTYSLSSKLGTVTNTTNTTRQETFSLQDTKADEVTYQYRIEWAKIPVYYPNGDALSGSGVGGTVLRTFKTDLMWMHYEKKYHWVSFGNHDYFNDHWGLVCYNKSDYDFSTGKDGHDIYTHKWLMGCSQDGDNIYEYTVGNPYYGVHGSETHKTITGSRYWKLIDNPSEIGKIYTPEEFKKIALYYIDPNQSDKAYDDFEDTADFMKRKENCWTWKGERDDLNDYKNHNGFAKEIAIDGIVTETCSAILEKSTDTSYTEEAYGSLTIKYYNAYLNKSDTANYTVIRRVRNCSKTYSGS